MNIRSKETYLTAEQIAQLLKLPQVTIQRWEHQGKIPCKIVNKQVMFKKSEIIAWAKQHELTIHEQNAKEKQHTSSLTMAIEKGQIHHNIQGNDIYSVFENALKRLPFISGDNFKDVLEALLDREELNSTGIGNGIAIPHTRNRMDIGIPEAHVAVFFLDSALTFSAIDEEAVYVLFMIFTSSVKEHLKILSKISFILHQQKVIKILQQRNQNNDLLSTIEQLEK